MKRRAVAIASTGHEALHGVLGFRSCGPQRECTISTGRDHGEWSVALDMTSPISQQPRRSDFPVDDEAPIRRRGRLAAIIGWEEWCVSFVLVSNVLISAQGSERIRSA